jgi:hypothetical protein
VNTPLPRLTGLTGEWYGWLARHELRFQRCTDCGRWRHVPRELCPDCGSAGWSWQPSSGRGTVHTWSITHRALHPAFPDTPFAQVVVELVEGPRVLSTVVDVAPDQLEIGMPVIVEFHRVTDEVTLPRFAPAPHPHRPSDEPCPSASC